MFDQVYDFFFGDQLRKYVVLISAFFLGQIFAIPLLGWLESSQYVLFAVTISFIAICPLILLYNWLHPIRREVRLVVHDQESIEYIPSLEVIPSETEQLEKWIHSIDIKFLELSRKSELSREQRKKLAVLMAAYTERLNLLYDEIKSQKGSKENSESKIP